MKIKMLEGENLNLDYATHIKLGKQLYGRFFNVTHFTGSKRQMKILISALELVYAVALDDDMVIFMYKNWSGNLFYNILTIGNKVSILELTANR